MHDGYCIVRCERESEISQQSVKIVPELVENVGRRRCDVVVILDGPLHRADRQAAPVPRPDGNRRPQRVPGRPAQTQMGPGGTLPSLSSL